MSEINDRISKAIWQAERNFQHCSDLFESLGQIKVEIEGLRTRYDATAKRLDERISETKEEIKELSERVREKQAEAEKQIEYIEKEGRAQLASIKKDIIALEMTNIKRAAIGGGAAVGGVGLWEMVQQLIRAFAG